MKIYSRRDVLKSSAVVAGVAFASNALNSAGGNRLALASALPNNPEIAFPSAPRDRLAVASWPFRGYIESPTNKYRDKKQTGMDLRDFAAQVRNRFGVPGVEPLSSHFSSTEAKYLESFRAALDRAGVHVVNIPVDNQHSYYDADSAARKQAVENGKKWIDVAVIIGSPSVRTSIAEARDAKPDVNLAADEIRRVVDYAAAKNIIVNLENDNLISENALFVVNVIEKVNHPYLRALPDFCNSMAGGDEKFNYDAVTRMFQHAYNICHVKDSEVSESGKMVRVDLQRTFGILKASHYRGYCSMEWEGGGDPQEGTHKLIDASLKNLS